MSEYSFSLTTFNPSGKLIQIEHALSGVNNHGRPALGIKAKNGIVLACQKKSPNVHLIDESTIHKIEEINPFIGCTYSGMPADFRVVLARARKEAQAYWAKYYEHMPVKQLVSQVASIVQEFTQSGGVRPLGISLLVCGYDNRKKMQLYQIDPSGAYFAWKATSIGKDSSSAKSFLERRYSEDMELDDAIHTAILTLKDHFDGVMNELSVQIGVVNEKGQFRVLSAEETKDYIAETD